MALHTERLVVRAKEMNSLDQVLAELDQGRSTALLLVGEPGIGKTRLPAELAVRALPRPPCVRAPRDVERAKRATEARSQ